MKDQVAGNLTSPSAVDSFKANFERTPGSSTDPLAEPQGHFKYLSLFHKQKPKHGASAAVAAAAGAPPMLAPLQGKEADGGDEGDGSLELDGRRRRRKKRPLYLRIQASYQKKLVEAESEKVRAAPRCLLCHAVWCALV